MTTTTHALKPGSQVIVTICSRWNANRKKLATVEKVHRNGRFTVKQFEGQWKPIRDDEGELCSDYHKTCALATPERLAEYEAEIADEKLKSRGYTAQNTIRYLKGGDMTPELVEALERVCDLAAKQAAE